jgi:exosome complex RNA-binding protein Csl4
MGFTGNIHISKVAGRYIDKIDSVVSKNDFIIAKVVKKNHAEYALRTNDPSLGVIKTYCKYCGKKMDRKGKDQVVCPFCNHFERKLLANDFNEINLVLDL